MRLPKRFLFLTVFVLACGAAAWWRLSPPSVHRNEKSFFTPQAPMPAAFLEAHWGMSPSQVEAADHLKLRPYASFRRLYRLNDKIGNSSRYKTLQAELPDFLGKPATASYVFFDDRLFLYNISMEGDDADQLNDRLKPYLVDRFGSRFVSPKDSSRLKAIWMQKDVIVNYWAFLDDQRLHPKFLAVFSVEYRPIAEAVDALTA